MFNGNVFSTYFPTHLTPVCIRLIDGFKGADFLKHPLYISQDTALVIPHMRCIIDDYMAANCINDINKSAVQNQ